MFTYVFHANRARAGTVCTVRYHKSTIGPFVDSPCGATARARAGARAGFFYTPFLSRFYGIQFYGFRVRAVQDSWFAVHVLCGTIPPEPVKGGLVSLRSVREFPVKID